MKTTTENWCPKYSCSNDADYQVCNDFEMFCEREEPDYIDLDDVICYFEYMEEEGRDIASDLTPELYRTIWNDLVDMYREEVDSL